MMLCISEYLQEHYNTVYDESYALFCSLRSDVPGTIFQREYQLKAIAIGIVEDNPLD